MPMPAHAAIKDANHWFGAEPAGASRSVYLGIMQDLESGRMVPGQRLAETDLAQRFEVGRNAVREAMQHLAARGVVDLSPNRSPAIRQLDLAESLEVLDVAEAMTRLAARAAAAGYRTEHKALVKAAMADLDQAGTSGEASMFSRARRNFYRTILTIGGNRELQRILPAIGMHVIHIQYASPMLQQIRLRDYRVIAGAISAGDVAAADAAAMAHVANVRAAILDWTDR